jgi:ABC-type polysaccharide/polyol phosphate export permease
MMPKAFLSDCMQQIVQINPISYGIDGMRALIISGFDPNKVFPAIIVPGTIAALSITGATLNVSQPRRMNQ